MEPMLHDHVLPELTSQQPFLRIRALWLYGEFGDFKFKDANHVNQAVDLIFRNLQDPDLPIRLTAATSIHKLLHNEIALNFMKPALNSILQIFLKLMGEIDSEELVEALEEIVDHYKDDISPFALQLAEHLVESYQRLIGTNVEEDDGEGALAAVGCVETIKRILESCKNSADLLP